MGDEKSITNKTNVPNADIIKMWLWEGVISIIATVTTLRSSSNVVTVLKILLVFP